MDAIVREQRVVRQLIRRFRKKFIDLVLAEFFFAFAAHLLPMLQTTLAQKSTNWQIHRMIGRDHVHAPDVDFLFQKPIANAVMRTGMAMNVTFFIGIRTQERILVPAGVNEEDVAVAHLHALFDVFRTKHVQVVEHVAQIDDNAGSVTPFDWNLIDCFAFGDKVTRRIEMRAHVIRCHDVLRVDALLRLALDVLDLERRIKGPERTILVEGLREIVDFHFFTSRNFSPQRTQRTQRKRKLSSVLSVTSVVIDIFLQTQRVLVQNIPSADVPDRRRFVPRRHLCARCRC